MTHSCFKTYCARESSLHSSKLAVRPAVLKQQRPSKENGETKKKGKKKKKCGVVVEGGSFRVDAHWRWGRARSGEAALFDGRVGIWLTPHFVFLPVCPAGQAEEVSGPCSAQGCWRSKIKTATSRNNSCPVPQTRETVYPLL